MSREFIIYIVIASYSLHILQWQNSSDKTVQLRHKISSNARLQRPSPHGPQPLILTPPILNTCQAASVAFKPRCQGPLIVKAKSRRLCPFATNDLALSPGSCSQVGIHMFENR